MRIISVAAAAALFAALFSGVSAASTVVAQGYNAQSAVELVAEKKPAKKKKAKKPAKKEEKKS